MSYSPTGMYRTLNRRSGLGLAGRSLDGQNKWPKLAWRKDIIKRIDFSVIFFTFCTPKAITIGQNRIWNIYDQYKTRSKEAKDRDGPMMRYYMYRSNILLCLHVMPISAIYFAEAPRQHQTPHRPPTSKPCVLCSPVQ